MGTARGLETTLVPEAGFPLELVKSGQLKNVSLATRARTMLDLPLGVLHCMKLMRRIQAAVRCGRGWVCEWAGDDGGGVAARAHAGV